MRTPSATPMLTRPAPHAVMPVHAPKNDAGQAPGRRRLRHDDAGVVAIEFALILPFLLGFIFLITDFARLFNYLNDANQIAANGARLAAVNNYPGDSAMRQTGDTVELRTGGSHLPGGLSVCLRMPSSAVGQPVTVETSGTFKLVPLLGKLGIPVNVPFHGKSTMRLERVSTATPTC